MKTVTALRAAGPGRVHVELDGGRWRTMPLEAVVAAHLEEGVALDRARVRRLARELRRLAALRTATEALRHRNRSVAELTEKLQRRGIRAADRERALETLERAGLADDARFASERAAALAGRGSGDALIRDDLERRGVDPESVDAAIALLEPEHVRVERLVATRGPSHRTARYLAARGFDSDSIASAVALDGAGE